MESILCWLASPESGSAWNVIAMPSDTSLENTAFPLLAGPMANSIHFPFSVLGSWLV